MALSGRVIVHKTVYLKWLLTSVLVRRYDSLVLQWRRSIVSLPTRALRALKRRPLCIEILYNNPLVSFFSGCAVHRSFDGSAAVGDRDGVHWRGIPQDLHCAAEGEEAAAAAGRQHDARRGTGHGVSYPYQQIQSATLFRNAAEQKKNGFERTSGCREAQRSSEW